MAAPVIKVHRVPDDYNPSLDVGESYNLHDIKTVTAGSPAGYRNCRLIERAVDGTLSATADAYAFSAHTLIRLVPIAPGSKTYAIDIGAGKYHDTNKSGFFTENNWVIGNASSFTLEDWVLDHREFAPPGGEINPRFLQFQVFAKRTAVFLSNPGASSESISLNYTYIPYFGTYSFRWNETGHPGGDLNFFGDLKPVYQEYNISQDSMVWAGGLNYTIDRINKQITFADHIYDEETLANYEIYVRMFIYRTNNNHSASLGGAVRSGEQIFYAIPHDDLVEGSWGTPSFIGSGTPAIQASQGLIRYERTTAGHYPPNGTTVTLNSYQYHRWIRVGNDMTDDFIFKKYIKTGTGVDYNEVFNYENSDDPNGAKGLIENPPNQSQQEHVNFAYGDIKITNEATHNNLDPPQLVDVFVDFLPRGNVSGSQNFEQITYGIAGLVNEYRPWDHQEGSPVETYQACFARATRNYIDLYRKPIDGYPNPSELHDGSGNYWDDKDEPLYENPMYMMNAGQAWRIKRWYQSSPSNSSGTGLHFRLGNPELIMKDAQSTSDPSAVLDGTGHPTAGNNILYVRVVYILFDGGVDPPIKSPVVTAPKTWSMKVRGDYLE